MSRTTTIFHKAYSPTMVVLPVGRRRRRTLPLGIEGILITIWNGEKRNACGENNRFRTNRQTAFDIPQVNSTTVKNAILFSLSPSSNICTTAARPHRICGGAIFASQKYFETREIYSMWIPVPRWRVVRRYLNGRSSFLVMMINIYKPPTTKQRPRPICWHLCECVS